jgi:hypothetical protein
MKLQLGDRLPSSEALQRLWTLNVAAESERSRQVLFQLPKKVQVRIFEADEAFSILDKLSALRRFDRQGLLRDIANGTKRDTRSYWRDIPSNNLYIPSDKITNLNVRYLTAEEVVALGASARLQGEGLPFDVEPATDLLDPVLVPPRGLVREQRRPLRGHQTIFRGGEIVTSRIPNPAGCRRLDGRTERRRKLSLDPERIHNVPATD